MRKEYYGKFYNAGIVLRYIGGGYIITIPEDEKFVQDI